MPRLTLYPNGIVAAPSRGTGNRAPSTRERITGWTAGSARRNDIFLRSVDFAAIEASGLYGWAATLTLRSAPATAEEFKKRLRRFLQRLVDATAQLIHYVIEMQPRKNSPDGPVPHVHLVGFFPQDYGPHVMTPKGPLGGGIFFFVFWQDQFLDFEPLLHAQHFAPITDPGGWARYVAKHGARSEGHYQRLRGMLPAGWQNTGRVWGTLGDWPVRKDAVHLSDRAFYALRRVVTRLQLADARRSIAKLEARLADSANAKQQVRNRRLLVLRRGSIRGRKRTVRTRPWSSRRPSSSAGTSGAADCQG